MEYLEITGRKKLNGCARLHGAKNSVLPILAATVLIKGESIIHNCPKLSDVEYTCEILRHLGADVKREGDTLIINTLTIDKYDIPEALMQEMRSSIIFLGALTSRQKRSCLFLPGGCEIGLRPIDLHLKALSELGYRIEFDKRDLCCVFTEKKADNIALSFPSVGATENLILASATLKGKTRIINAAREPEIIDLCNFLNSAGARISGAGNTVIEIEGVSSLHSCEHTVIPDRILASTLMSAAAITKSELIITRVIPSQLANVFSIFNELGCKIYLDKNSLVIKSPKSLRRVKKLETRPYPGFPTDSQSTLCSVLSVANGVSLVHETLFENRFKFVGELERFGADITVHDRFAIINGVSALHGATAECTDLRGGAALVVAALAADGVSKITKLKHIDRGYESIENQLAPLGAEIKRISDEKEGKSK